jgi:hypothetical protein
LNDPEHQPNVSLHRIAATVLSRKFLSPRGRIVSLLFSLLFLLVAVPAAAERACRHLVILGDPHVPGQHMACKRQVLETINSWPDVDLVVAVGISARTAGPSRSTGR